MTEKHKAPIFTVLAVLSMLMIFPVASMADTTATDIVHQKAQFEAERFNAISNAMQLEYTIRYNTYVEALKTNPSATMRNRLGTVTNWNLNNSISDLVAGGYLPSSISGSDYSIASNAANPKHLDVGRTGLETAIAQFVPTYNPKTSFAGTTVSMTVTLPFAASDMENYFRRDSANNVAYNTVTGAGCTLEWVGGNGVITGLGTLTADNLSAATSGGNIAVGSNLSLGTNVLTASQLEATNTLRTATLQTTGNAAITGTLGVTGASNLRNTTVTGTMNVTGATTLGGDVTVNGNVSASGKTITIGTINGQAITIAAPNDTTNALSVANGIVNLVNADKITTGGTTGVTDAQANSGALIDGRLRVKDLSIYKDGKYQDMTALLSKAGGSGTGGETLDVKTLRVSRIVFYDATDFEGDASTGYKVKDSAIVNDGVNARLEYAKGTTGDQRIEYKIGGTYVPGSYYKNYDGSIVTQPITPVNMTPNFKYGNTPETMDARPQTAGGTMRIDIPDKVNAMRVQLWGQVNGGYSDAVFPVTKGETYYIFAGLGVLKAPDSWNVAARLAATAPARVATSGADGVAGHLHPVNHAIVFAGNMGGKTSYITTGGYGGGYYGTSSTGPSDGGSGSTGASYYQGGRGFYNGLYYGGAGSYNIGTGNCYAGPVCAHGGMGYGGGGGWAGGQGTPGQEYRGGSGSGTGSVRGNGAGGGGYFGGGAGYHGGAGSGGSGYVNMAPFYPQPNVATVHNTTTTLAGQGYFPKTLNVTLMPERANKQGYLVRQETNIIRPNYPLTDALGGSSATMNQGYCRISLYEGYTFNTNTLKSIGTVVGSRLSYSAIATTAADTFYLEGYKLQSITIPVGTKRMRVMLRGGGNTYSEGIVDTTEYDTGKYYAYINPTITTPSGTGTAAVFYVGSNELTLSDLGECKAKACSTTQNTAWLKRIKDFNSLRVAVANAPKDGIWGPNCYDYGFTGIYNPNDNGTCFTAYNGYDRTFGHGTWNATTKRIVPVATEGTNGWGYMSGHAYTAVYQGKKFYNTIVTSYFPEGTENTIYVEFFK